MSDYDPNTTEQERRSLEQIKQDLAERGIIWEEQPLYLRYAVELLGRDPAEEPLPDSMTDTAIKPPWFPYYLTAGEDRWLFSEVAGEVNLSLDQWDRLSETERLPFMKRAIEGRQLAEAEKPCEQSGNPPSTPPAASADTSKPGKLISEHSGADDLTPAKELADRFEKAYRSYKLAEQQLLNRGTETVTDRRAWDFLNEHGVDDYTPEPFDTWQRYVREARKFYDDRKNTPRGGREGGSVVPANMIEQQRDDDVP